MIFQEHQVADSVVGIDAAGGIGQNHGVDAELFHDADGKGHRLHGVALVEVRPTLLGGDDMALEFADYQVSLVAVHRGGGPAGDFAIGDHSLGVQGIGQGTQSGTQDEPDPGL